MKSVRGCRVPRYVGSNERIRLRLASCRESVAPVGKIDVAPVTAIGVSGGSGDRDHAVAEAGAAAF